MFALLTYANTSQASEYLTKNMAHPNHHDSSSRRYQKHIIAGSRHHHKMAWLYNAIITICILSSSASFSGKLFLGMPSCHFDEKETRMIMRDGLETRGKSSLCTMLLGKDSHGVANILANSFAKNDKKPSAP